MTACIHALAIRFADLWADDHHRMVDEIYSPTIHMESMTGLDHVPIEDGAALHALEDRLVAMIPEHRHELVRVIAGDGVACLETTIVSPTTGEYAPACVWWWLDDRGQVGEEVGFFDWNRRTTDSRLVHGHVPRHDHRPRAASSVSNVLDALVAGTLADHLAPGCGIEAVGVGRCELPGPVAVREHVSDGSVLAALVTGTDGEQVWRGTVVLSLDGDDRVVNVRVYTDPERAIAPAGIHPAMRFNRPARTP